jgi:hypothetical protein
MNNDKSLRKQSKAIPLSVKTLKDLRPYGYLKSDFFKQSSLEQESDFIELKYVQDRERLKYKEDPWKYYINFYNFRDEWDFTSTKKRIGFFGCSFTFGEGIKSEDTFAKIVGRETDLNCFNFGVGGSSIERIARTFSAVTRVINLDIAVITLPAWHRQMHVGKSGDIINLMPGYSHLNVGYEKLSEALTTLDENFYLVRATTSINWIYDISCYKNIKVLFTSWDHPLNNFCKLLLPDNTLKPFPNIDDKCARDNLHPGVKSQRAHASQIIEAIHDRTWI